MTPSSILAAFESKAERVGDAVRWPTPSFSSRHIALDRARCGYRTVALAHALPNRARFVGGPGRGWSLSLRVEAGEMVTLVGSNGAGKSTLLNAICGIVQPTAGRVRIDGTDITGWSSEAIVAEGITQVPEGRRLFPQMTVRENLLMGAYRRRDHRGIEQDMEAMYELFPILKDRQRQRAGSMSGGEQQMCAIGRGLMARPRILILDELSLGLAPIMLDVLVDALQHVHAEGTTVFVVEQDVATAFDLATTGYVLENGRVVLSGPTADLRSNPHVKKAYLGL